MPGVADSMWDCREARAEIALRAGGDSSDTAAAERLQTHLSSCRGCREYTAGMSVMMADLQSCAGETPRMTASLWPRLKQRLPAQATTTVAARFNLWVPTAAMAAACAAMVFATVVQLERVAPFNPAVAPHLHSLLHGASSRNLFDSDTAFDDARLPQRHLLLDGNAVPVNWPARPPAFRYDYSPAPFTAPSADREW